ncbi:hypothetical protein M413DRAFT_446483 [Hebeloma cylindrosporum]|uniref:HD domain-containing protein n=1 Tax=Hebeloma cylindrosporum TaxID=76867 RepID=A0A0C3C9P1_HEBCY|nr:hypothetical protein M413DRAFT_446483 [Hebeloma cylindrosporum h7]
MLNCTTLFLRLRNFGKLASRFPPPLIREYLALNTRESKFAKLPGERNPPRGMETPVALEHEDQIDNILDEPFVMLRQIKDTIHGYIPISATLTRFIDTEHFQRLRYIKQLGTTHFVWPGASHSRFEHCLGVAFLARCMATHFKLSQPDLKITERDVTCVEIAGLCHDLGHGPWSHVFDGLIVPKILPGSTWTHELGSEMMFDSLVKENEIPISQRDQTFIKALIAGDHSRTPEEKPFLFDIVANKRNGLDVDKFDYIQRDSHMIADSINVSPVRIINSARVLDDQICYDIKDANNIYDICAARFKLHKSIYNHRTAKGVEYMIVDALISAEGVLKLAERIFDPKKYLYLTDDIMREIESSERPELAEARAIFKRIRKRDLYKWVDYKVIDWPHREYFRLNVTSKAIVDAANALNPAGEGSSALEEDDVRVDFPVMHYGMKEKNPLDFVRFYSKRTPNESSKAERGVYSNLMPQYFAEHVLRIYTKKTDHFGLVQAGYRAVLASLQKKYPDLDVGMPVFTSDQLAPTPPATEAPTTPKAHSRTTSYTALGGGSGTTPFSNNSFTTVPQTFVPGSPSRTTKRAKGIKRTRDDEEDGPRSDKVVKKRK